MSTYGDCKTCGAIVVNLSLHRCPPKRKVTFGKTDDPDFECEVYERHPEDAARAAAALYDDDTESPIASAAGARGWTCTVHGIDGEPDRVFEVFGEYVPTYWAEKKEES